MFDTPESEQPKGWYVVETKRHRETLAAAALRDKGIASYSPRVIQWPPPAVGSPIQPMFPGYLLVRAALPEDFYRVTWTTGIRKWVTFGAEPPSLDPAVVEFLRGCEGADGIIHCGEPEESAEVRIIRGPFRGLTAIISRRFPARERVRVLLDLLRRDTPVELPERWVTRI